MGKLKEYYNMALAVRAARRNLALAKQKITAYNKEYRLGAGGYGECACINRFEKVIIDVPNTTQVDDGGFVEVCELLDTGALCENIRCPMYANHLDYVVALEKYNGACDARRNFLRGLLKKRSK